MTDEEITKAIYEAMQVPYLSERHDAIKKLITQYGLSERTDLITEVVNWDFYHASLIPNKDDYSPDDFSITKSRYKDGALKIEIRVAPYLEAQLTQKKEDNHG